ncbi:MAG: protein-export chaperone SecB [Zetaproteobacteria bacterium CG12_big_fil_rev_8_21_14_0_65_54_13]|nr:MAG: protein-export chaperone SecB [Zetaproteobacteria bacterium CG12_big_fil_rev_8_21_14_0_65_54_13]PIX55691.1 MAG: protein-export chaperone SecB [Zetaproteobacteria bacterium CG_4_10_14_3_um_filter_54_28]PJA29352.1 MAG: protein-export chaperone SecB [Zetaproteobacteria bacterium CG_4_9_14_3_um_filter_54_145]
MTEQEIPEMDAETPAFNLQKIYIKDISFENPNAPEIYIAEGTQPKFEINLGVKHRQLDSEHWEVSLKISVISKEVQNEQLLFEVEVEHAAVFYLKNIDAEHIPLLLAVDCPTIIFPYTRQIISQLTIDGGFMPLLMEPVNFRAVCENSLAQSEHQVH